MSASVASALATAARRSAGVPSERLRLAEALTSVASTSFVDPNACPWKNVWRPSRYEEPKLVFTFGRYAPVAARTLAAAVRRRFSAFWYVGLFCRATAMASASVRVPPATGVAWADAAAGSAVSAVQIVASAKTVNRMGPGDE